jgi:hypothetical protein
MSTFLLNFEFYNIFQFFCEAKCIKLFIHFASQKKILQTSLNIIENLINVKDFTINKFCFFIKKIQNLLIRKHKFI